MTHPAPDSPHSTRGWHVLLAAWGVYTAVILVVVANRAESSSDFRDFWENAVHFRQTGQIAADLGVHNYLPFFTIFMLPWSLLPLRAAIVLFTLLSLGLFAITGRHGRGAPARRLGHGSAPILLVRASLGAALRPLLRRAGQRRPAGAVSDRDGLVLRGAWPRVGSRRRPGVGHAHQAHAGNAHRLLPAAAPLAHCGGPRRPS